VQAQPTRSREQNRTAARHILRDRLDLLRATGALPGEQGSLNEVEGIQAEGKAAKKAELAKMAGMYAKDELRAAKVRQRKADRAKKHRKKKREEEEEEEGSADKEDRL